MSSSRPIVALLPLYLEVYDKTLPELLPAQQPFLDRVASLIRAQGADVTVLPVCRKRAQVEQAVARAESSGAVGIITLHLAYSPSLESGPPLTATELPILVLDTTPGLSFGIDATYDDVLASHGIHGVQDLTSFLRRSSRSYSLAVGPIESPLLAAKTAAWLRAASARALLRSLTVAQIGGSFEGMGDFSVTPDFLRSQVGPTVAPLDVTRVGALCAEVTAAELAAERTADAAAFDCSACPPETWDRANRNGLALRRALGELNADAFAFNFLVFDRAQGVSTVPFLEASKAMARGMGYAGEGDVLTASLVAALNRCYAATTFTEMFCPDWQGGRLFMAHMGECNPVLAAAPPRLIEMDYRYGPVDPPALLVFPLQAGQATLANLAPGPDDTLSLIAADVTVEDMGISPNMPTMPHFWITPPGGDVASFLERYSRAGGTHHLAMTPGVPASDLRQLAGLMGWRFVLID